MKELVCYSVIVEPTRLYSLRNNVVKYNTGKLESLPGRIEKFIAFDWVEEQELYPEKRLVREEIIYRLHCKH